MNDEMAEEWVKNNCCDLCVCQDECEIGCIHCGAKDGFLAGLKAGRPQWHDLRKDPNDLPEEDGFYLVKLDNDGLCNYEIDSFYLDDNFVLYGKYVIAWCEIPSFDKE